MKDLNLTIDILRFERDIKQQEIERLKEENNYYFKKNNEISTLNTFLRSDRDKYKNIIKEVREYIENVETLATIDKVNIFSISTLKSILDKGE